MKTLRILAFLALLGTAYAQTVHTFPALDTTNVFTGQNTFPGINLGLTIPFATSGIANGTIAVALNGSTTTDCTAGGGSNLVFCIFNGVSWGPFGGGDTITSPNSTINVGGTSASTTLDLNLGTPNTWTGTQTFPSASITNAELAHSSLTVTAGTGLSGCGSVALGSSCTLAILTAYRLPQSCSNGNVPVWGTPTASQWNCGSGAAGLGDPGSNGVVSRTALNTTAATSLNTSQKLAGVTGSTPIALTDAVLDVRNYCPTPTTCNSSDFGAILNTALVAAGATTGTLSATVDLCGLVATGPYTVYASTNPFTGLSPSLRAQLRMNCNGLTIIHSVGWWTPQGATQILGASPGASASAGETVVFQPCVTSGGCGPSGNPTLIPLFNNCISSSSCVPLYGNAIVAGPPVTAPTAYSTGTCTFPTLASHSTTVTCSGGTLTQQMVGGVINNSATTWGGGTGTCVGRIKSISGSTITLDGYWIGVSGTPSGTQCKDSGVGSAESYTILEPNAVATICVSCLGSTSAVSSFDLNAFAHQMFGLKVDLEDLGNSIGIYNPVCQETCMFQNITVAESEAHQTCAAPTTGFAGCPNNSGPAAIAGFHHDYSFGSQATAGATHYDMISPKVNIASSGAASSTFYGIVEECWNQTQGKGTDGANIGLLSTLPGVGPFASQVLFAAQVYIDGCQSGETHVNHAEYGAKAVWLGQHNPTFGQILTVRTSNFGGGTGTNVYFDANAGTCNAVLLDESQASGNVLINDTVNSITINNSSSNKVALPYFQTCPLASWLNGVSFTQGALVATGITDSAITGSTQCVQANSSGVLSGTGSACGSGGASALSAITAATTSNTIANGNHGAQVWNWAQTTNSQTAFTFGETTAASGTSDEELAVTTIAGSTAIPLTVTDSLTGSQTVAALQILPTWNTTGVVDAGIFENVTNTASGTASLLLDLQVGSTSQFKVDKVGNITGLGSLSLGSSPPSPCGGTGTGCVTAAEGSTAGTPTSAVDYIRADSTAHGFKLSLNNGAEFTSLMNYSAATVPAITAVSCAGCYVASGTSAMGTSAISSGACATVVTTTASGATTASVISATPTADPTGVTGYGPSASGSLYIQAYPTSGNVNFKVCNDTSSSITPSALTLNWRVF